jgi:hypothetical protein
MSDLQQKELVWEELPSKRVYRGKVERADEFIRLTILRSAVPGGWLVMSKVIHGTSLVFVPDPEHTWDGSSIDVPPAPADESDSRIRRAG